MATDPILDLAAAFTAAIHAYRDEPEETLTRARENTLSERIEQCRQRVMEAPTEALKARTPAGAAAAIRCFLAHIASIDPSRIDGADRVLLGSALAFLDDCDSASAQKESVTVGVPPGPHSVFKAAMCAEGDMITVYDLALILNDYMADRERISSEVQGALCHLTGQLLGVGERLKEHADVLLEASRPQGRASR